jgi:hypothetical protein
MSEMMLRSLLMAAMLLPASAHAQRDPAAPLFPESSPPAKMLEVVSLHGVPEDTKLAAITLQGLVNGGPESKVFMTTGDPESEGTLFWVKELENRAYIEGFEALDLDAYFAKYLPEAAGLVVYDPEVTGTVNVATMIAALERRVVVAPDDLDRFKELRPDVTDLRGRWKTNAEAYSWAFDTLFPQMNHDVLAAYHPFHAQHHLRDYLVRHKIFIVYVTGEHAEPHPAENHEAEKAVARRVLEATPPSIPVIGWWDGGHLDEGMTEYGGVGWAGEYGKVMLGSNWQNNLTLMAGVPVDMEKLYAKFQALAPEPKGIEPEEGKVYISYIVQESGDAPTYWEHVQPVQWRDPARGKVPIGWCMTPTLPEFLPTVAEWFAEQATPNDFLYASIAGWGYCHPYRNFMGRTPDPEAAWDLYLAQTAVRMERLGLRDLGLYTDAWRPYRRAEKDAVTRRFVEGIPGLRSLFMGMGRDEEITETSPHYLLDDTVVSHVFTRWLSEGRGEEANAWMANEIRTHTPAERPAFMLVHPLSWSYHPSDLADVAERLGDEYIVVSPVDLVDMIDRHLNTTQGE